MVRPIRCSRESFGSDDIVVVFGWLYICELLLDLLCHASRSVEYSVVHHDLICSAMTVMPCLGLPVRLMLKCILPVR
jgi:hypothetical protein